LHYPIIDAKRQEHGGHEQQANRRRQIIIPPPLLSFSRWSTGSGRFAVSSAVWLGIITTSTNFGVMPPTTGCPDVAYVH